MEAKSIVTCCGCLNNGRRMIQINEINLKKCFSEIVNETLISNCDSEILQLCFECTATLHKFTKFKEQVVSCYNTFHNHIKLNSSWPYSKPYIHNRIHQVFNLSSVQQTVVGVDGIKIESEIEDIDVLETDVKEELSSHEDEDPLIKIIQEKIVKDEVEQEREAECLEVRLSKAEIEEERRVLALRDDYVNAMFRCENCIISFPNEDDLKDHIKIKHDLNASNYRCPICTCSFGTEVSYNYHANKHARRYRCTVCAAAFTGRPAALRHYSAAHCYRIDRQFDDVTLHDADRSAEKDCDDISANKELSFTCEYCAKVFKWKTSLRKHLETHSIETGQKRKPYCAPCRLFFTTTPNLQKHVKTSARHKIQLKLRKLKETSESCDTQIEEIKSSVRKSRPQHQCHQCDKRFLWRGNLLRHLHSHAAKAKGELVCKPCDKVFSSIATYQQHMKISKKHVSENEFKYMCSDCGKRFPTKTQLRDHINWEHLKNYVYNCDECQKAFKTNTSVYLHKQAVHRKDIVEQLCDHCGKHFPNNAKLRNHLMGLHRAGAALQCALCGARFSWQSCLSRHMRQKHRRPTSKMT